MKKMEPKTQMARAIPCIYIFVIVLFIWCTIGVVLDRMGPVSWTLFSFLMFSLIVIASTFSSIKSRLDDTDKRLQHLERPQD